MINHHLLFIPNISRCKHHLQIRNGIPNGGRSEAHFSLIFLYGAAMSYEARKLCTSTVAYLTSLSMKCTGPPKVHSILVSITHHGEEGRVRWDFR